MRAASRIVGAPGWAGAGDGEWGMVGAMTRRDPVLVAWAAGLGLALLVFLVGPDHFLLRIGDALHGLVWRLGDVIRQLSATALDVVRALSIGLFVTYLGLAGAVHRRGGRVRGGVVVVSLLFVLLVGDAGRGDQTRWVAALALSGIGAAVMTGRLRHGPAGTRGVPLRP